MNELNTILSEEDIEKINWDDIGNYDFSKTPDKLRNKLLGDFLAYSYAQEYYKYFKQTKKPLSQNKYAREMLNITPMGLSTYKSGDRMPTVENLDNIAKHLGPIIYDICGVSRRMPSELLFEELAEIWTKLDENQKNEVIDFANNIHKNDL